MTTRQLASLANQIRRTLDLNNDTMLFSNSIQFRLILSEYIEMNSAAVQSIDDSTINIGPLRSNPTIEDIMIDFIILLKAKKIYRFSEYTLETGHNIRYTDQMNLTNNLYDEAFSMNNIIGNLEITLIPLYYQTRTIVPSLNSPSGVTLDSSGNLYIADTLNHRICRRDTSGNLTVYAGSGVAGYRDGGPTVAQFNHPTAIAADLQGNIYVADTYNNCVRIIERNYVFDPSGSIIAIDGIIGTLVGNGPSINSQGVGSGVLVNRPRGVAVDASGCVYISDTGNHRICKVVSGGSLMTMAGLASIDGSLRYFPGYVNDQGINAGFNSPTGLTVDLKGNVFVADTGNNVIRRVTPSGRVSTVAGSGQPFFKEGKKEHASFNQPTGITVDLHNVLYVTDTGNNMIRRITNEGHVIPVVGSPDQKTGAIDGYGAIDPMRALVPFPTRATFHSPAAIVVDPLRNLYIADTGNNSVRKIDPTFSTPTNIKPIAMQALRISRAPGVAYTLGPTLSASLCPANSIIYGHQRGRAHR